MKTSRSIFAQLAKKSEVESFKDDQNDTWPCLKWMKQSTIIDPIWNCTNLLFRNDRIAGQILELNPIQISA